MVPTAGSTDFDEVHPELTVIGGQIFAGGYFRPAPDVAHVTARRDHKMVG